MTHTSHIELSRTAIEHNIRFIRERIGPDVTLFTVLKGNAYGHGIEQMVPPLMRAGVHHFATYDAAEALRVRSAGGDYCDVMIMGFIDDTELAWAIENGIGCYVFEHSRLEKLIACAERLRLKARIHLEVETGFNRTGFRGDDLDRAMALLLDHQEHIELEGLCTHYAGAESTGNHDRVAAQISCFNRIREQVKTAGLRPRRYHTACSAAVMNFPESIMEMVRIGILTYGFWPSRETEARYLAHSPAERNPLRRVISWKSRVIAVKEVPAGEYIGYGSSYLTGEPTRIAVVPVGYGYGFTRSLSNRGRVLIRGRRLAVVGVVNMNMIMVDATELPDVCVGDEVVLIGSQGDLSISVSSFSELSDQLNYEMLTRLPATIPRRVVE